MSTEKQFTIQRLINAPVDLVWKAHTEAEHLIKWWGPKGMTMKVANVDLRPGGLFHYGIEMPDGSMLWAKFVYKEIVPPVKLIFFASFSDENAGYARHPMAPDYPREVRTEITLEEKDGKTLLTLQLLPVNAAQQELDLFYSLFESMNGGYGGTYDKLDEHLAAIQK